MVLVVRSLFINCGGQETHFNGNLYEGDTTRDEQSKFSFSERWGYSSTGIFMDNDTAQYTSSNNSLLGVYGTARLAPVSLKYYGFCLQSGSYHVKLHFAETMFTATADQKFSSLGRRIFDISIQVSGNTMTY